MTIYQPAEDSYLLSEEVKNYLIKIKNKKINQGFKILDMGSGSGIQAKTCKKLGFNSILCADINQKAVEHLKRQGFKAIKTNLFSNINKKEKFDLIIFNPPYLPEDKREPKDSRTNTTAGKKGYELIIHFLKQAKSYLSDKGVILLLFSSLSQPKIIINKTEALGYKIRLINNLKLDFEELYIYGLKLNMSRILITTPFKVW